MKIKLLTKITLKEDKELEMLYKKYFKKEKEETNLDFKKINLILKKFPKSEAIVIDKKTIIGEVTTIPTNKKIMKEFLESKITEQEMIDKSLDKISLKNFNSLYLCYFILEKKYRGKEITSKAIEKIIDYYIKINPKITLFVWPFSKAGEKVAIKISEKFYLPLIIKK